METNSSNRFINYTQTTSPQANNQNCDAQVNQMPYNNFCQAQPYMQNNNVAFELATSIDTCRELVQENAKLKKQVQTFQNLSDNFYVLTNNDTLYLRYKMNDYILFQTKLLKIIKVVNPASNSSSICFALFFDNAANGILLLDEKQLKSRNLIKLISFHLEEDIAANNVAINKLSTAFASFIFKNYENTYTVLRNAGWHKGNFVTFSNDNAFEKVIMQKYNLPYLSKRHLCNNEKNVSIEHLPPNPNNASTFSYIILFYGSMINTLLTDDQLKFRPVGWIPNDSIGKICRQNCLSIWDNYAECCETGKKKDIITAFANAKDELIFFEKTSSYNSNNITDIIEATNCGFNIFGKQEIHALPIIFSEDYHDMELSNDSMTILPLLIAEENIAKYSNSSTRAFLFISWIEKNLTDINAAISYYKNTISFPASSTNYCELVLLIYTMYFNNSLQFQDHLDFVHSQCEIALKYIKQLLNRSYAEILKDYILFAINKDLLTVIPCNDHSNTKNKVSLWYETDGSCYISRENLKSIVRPFPIKALLTGLANEKAIYSEKNGNNKISYTKKIPFNSNNSRMVKILPGVLMDKEGAAFGGEILC